MIEIETCMCTEKNNDTGQGEGRGDQDARRARPIQKGKEKEKPFLEYLSLFAFTFAGNARGDRTRMMLACKLKNDARRTSSSLSRRRYSET